jgi:putative PEP-CTERM system TPR-repeat lipoprotein
VVKFRTPPARYAAAVLLALASAAHAQSSNPKAAQLYEDARTRYAQGDMPGAIIQLKNSLQIDRNQLGVQLLLGQALLATSDVNGAEVALQEALRLGVNRSEVVLSLARAVMEQGKPRDVLDQPRFALDGLPPPVRLQMHLLRVGAAADLGDLRAANTELDLAKALNLLPLDVALAEVPLRIRTGQWPEALAAAQRAVQLAPQNAAAHYSLGSVLHVQSQLQRAVASYNQAITLQPLHTEALLARAGLYLDQERLEQALADITTLRKALPKEPRAAYLASVIAEKRGDGAGARAALVELTTLLDPVPIEFMRYRPQLLLLGGLAHFGLGQAEKAKPYLEATNRAQGNLAASKLLAQIYLAEGNVDRAVNTLETYLARSPTDASAVELLAQAHTRSGRASRAQQVLRDSLRQAESPRLRMALGLNLAAANQPEEARKELETALKADPGLTRAKAGLANLALQANDLPKAQKLIDQLLKEQPKHPGYQQLLGQLQLRRGDRAAARKAFDTATQLDPAAIPPRLQLARLDAAAGQFDAAQRRLEQILASPGQAKALEPMLELALLNDQRGQKAQAQQWLTRAMDNGPAGDKRAALLLMDLHLRHGEPALAVKVATDKLNGLGSEDVPVLLATSRALLANQDNTGARTLLTRAARLAGFDTGVQVEIAALQLAAGNVPGATHSVDKALSNAPQHLPALAVRVDVLIRQGDLNGAGQLAKQLSQQHPGRAIGPLLEGNVAALRNQAPQAVAHFRRAHQVEPSSTTALRLHAALAATAPAEARALATQWLKRFPQDRAMHAAHADELARNGLYREAAPAYRALLAVAPRDKGGLNNLASVLMQLKDPGALAAAEAAFKQYPGDPDVIDTMAWASYQAGQKDRALQLLRDARLRAPNHPEVRYHLAQVLADLGRKAEAKQELAPILESGQRFASLAEARKLMETLK